MTEPGKPTPPSAPYLATPAWGEEDTAADAVPPPPAPPAAPPAPAPTAGYTPYQPPVYGVPEQYLQGTGGTETHQGALWSMIVGIVGVVSGVLAVPTSGITLIGMVCSPVALVMGLWAGGAIKKQPGRYANRGMATAGWILGLVGIAIGILMLLLVVAVIAFFVWIFSSVEGA